jgi:hypothetical protein
MFAGKNVITFTDTPFLSFSGGKTPPAAFFGLSKKLPFFRNFVKRGNLNT